MKPVTLAIVGAGSRGTTYSRFAEAFPMRARVVAVAEPRDAYRERLVSAHNLPAENVFTDWRQLAAVSRLADAVIIATQDRMHAEPAKAFADLGYDILLEKPMAPDAEGCHQIVEAVERNDVLFAVCHVLRYTRYTQKLKALIDAGTIGDLVGMQRLEPVGFWHMAHSFVRGHWHREDTSGPMLLTKSCHDLDWIQYIMGAPCRAVSSFGSLKHFRPEEAPPGAGKRCVTCPVEPTCPYSAKRIYLEALRRGHRGWPLDVLTPDPTRESILQALEEGPYGRCVYDLDNDVVDHQVVSMAFEGGRTATFTMMAFTKMMQRKTRIFGTRGTLTGDGRFIEHYDFLTDTSSRIDTEPVEEASLEGHGGGDFGLMDAFVRAVAEQEPAWILSGPQESLDSHLLVFAAEQARREGKVVALQ
ncbi:MAG: Gfo/Idh/MocA family protein [Anaerolineae bacterium]